jgi:hypothetical protein
MEKDKRGEKQGRSNGWDGSNTRQCGAGSKEDTRRERPTAERKGPHTTGFQFQSSRPVVSSILPHHTTTTMPINWPAQATPGHDDDVSDTTSVSYPSSDDSYDPDDHAAMIQEEWEESLRQIETVLSVIILPFFGKWMGRRTAFWGECQWRG